MTKWLITFITTLTVLVFIAGCPTIKSEPAASPEVEILKHEPDDVQPDDVEPDEAGPPKIIPPKTEPNEPEPDKAELTKAEPNEPEPPGVIPRKIDVPKAEPPKAEPNEAETANAKPDKAQPTEPKPLPKVSFHDKCAPILNEFVNDSGMVNYRKLKLKRPELKALLNEFAKLDPNEYNAWPKNDKIAFWLNAYNIQMLKIIIDNYPIESYRILRVLPGWGPESIRHIDKRIAGIKKQKLTVMDEEFTLARIEQRFFRKEFDEPRVFFATSHATLSGPPLRNEPYYGHKLVQQLDDQTKRFLAGPRAFRIDREKQRVHLSALLQETWHGKQFIPGYGTDKRFKDQPPATRAVLNFITNYISEQNVAFLQLENYSVKYIKYDWTLNDGS